jgi:AraC family transcriptional regulator
MFEALEKEQIVGGHLRVRRWNKRHFGSLQAAGSVHAAVELSWVQGGEVHYDIGHTHYIVRSGQAMVVPPGVEHATRLEGATVAGSLWLGADAFYALADAAGVSARLEPGAVADATGVISLAQLLQSEAFEGGAGALMAADALSEALALRLARQAPRAARCGRNPGIRRALERIEQRYAEDLDVETLARTAAMSRYHFSRRFQEELGLSPYAYLQQWRLARAAELLKGGRAAVTEAAFSCGFSDLGRFGRKFRQRYGCAPSEFAAAS